MIAIVIWPGRCRARSARPRAEIDRQCGIHDQHGRIEGDETDRNKILDGVVKRVGAHMGIDRRHASRREIKRVAVRIGLRDKFGAKRAVGAGLVLYENDLAQWRPQLFGQQPCHEISGAARREPDDESYRPRRVILRQCSMRPNSAERDRERRCPDASADMTKQPHPYDHPSDFNSFVV